jgi:hypothetical protein
LRRRHLLAAAFCASRRTARGFTPARLSTAAATGGVLAEIRKRRPQGCLFVSQFLESAFGAQPRQALDFLT